MCDPSLVVAERETHGRRREQRPSKLHVIYAAVNFALYGRLICGSLGVVWAWSTHATVSSARMAGWAWSLHGMQT